jgi:hypothetical protein
MACSCPIDWVVCFRDACPRSAVYFQRQIELDRAARDFLGDPFKGVGGTATDPDPNLIQQLIDRGRSEA